MNSVDVYNISILQSERVLSRQRPPACHDCPFNLLFFSIYKLLSALPWGVFAVYRSLGTPNPNIVKTFN